MKKSVSLTIGHRTSTDLNGKKKSVSLTIWHRTNTDLNGKKEEVSIIDHLASDEHGLERKKEEVRISPCQSDAREGEGRSEK